MRKLSIGFAFILIIVLIGCNLPVAQTPPNSPSEAFTQAAETVAAELTQVSSLSSPIPNELTNTPTPAYTNTALATNTPAFTPTNTPIPCNLASFVTDVTYPDNTHVAPNQAFTKTWRIRNVGTCSWNSSYLLIFDHGDGIGVNSGYSQPLTSSVINPGQVADLQVNLIAPTASGTYTGYWNMRDPSGVLFGITAAGGTFLVKVIVVASVSVNLAPVMSESGSVRSDGAVYSGDINVGDTTDNYAIEAFISYDISSIPSKATITEVKDSFNSYTIGGDPFGHLGVLNGYKMNFAVPLDSGNFVSGFPTGNIIDWGATSILDLIELQPAIKTALQSKLGSQRFRLRLQFAGTNNDAAADFVHFTNPSLLITYTTP